MRTVACVAALALALSAGCSSTNTPSTPLPDAGGAATAPSPAPCSTGPAYTSTSQFASDGDSTVHPACTPRCGAESAHDPDGVYHIEALPSGACDASAPVCQMAVQIYCRCNGAPGARNEYKCSCVGGAWTCVIVPPVGSGGCGC